MNDSVGIYDSGFEAYKNVTSEEYQTVLRTGIVIVDTNVLLHLYRYHSGTRKDLIDILDAIKDQLWVPHQAMHEFWQRRSGVVVGRSKEIEDTVDGIRASGLHMNEGIRTWANRIGLPATEKQQILDRIETTIAYVSEQIRTLSAIEATVDASTESDPILFALEPILAGKVGRPLSPEILREAKKEALQRIADKRPPGWRDGQKKENKEGDYLVWFQSLQEAKKRGVDVLFVTDDAKADWWRIEHGETKGPLPELVHDMREVANVRLYMTRPETLLLHAKDVLGKEVSDDSIRDVQRVSNLVDMRSEAERSQERYFQYENAVATAIASLGYHLIRGDRERDTGFDLLIGSHAGTRRLIHAEIKYSSRPMNAWAVRHLAVRAGKSRSPVVLIANSSFDDSVQDAFARSAADVTAIVWKNDSDTQQLGLALKEIFDALAE